MTVTNSVPTRYKVVSGPNNYYPGQEEVELGDKIWYVPREAFERGYFGEGVDVVPSPLKGLLRSDGILTINGVVLPFEDVIMFELRPLFLTAVPVV